jgi:two-component system, OmpR family, response regulator
MIKFHQLAIRHSLYAKPMYVIPTPSEFSILVADDDAGIRNFLRRGLRLEGYLVTEADSGESAVELTRIKHPDLVILDWMMPGIGGPEALRRIKALSQNIPVIFLTGRDGNKADGLALGADDYFVKPVSFVELVERVHNLLPTKNIGEQQVIVPE